MQTGTGVLAGRVIDAGTNRPVAGVVVTIGGSAPTVAPAPGAAPPSAAGAGLAGAAVAPPRPAVPRVLTDADGRFVFRNLPPSRFTLLASKPGYSDGALGRVRPGGSMLPVTLNDGERKVDLTIRLFRFGTIAGRVVDDLGEPAIGIVVRAFRRSIVAGRRQLTPAVSPVATDDRGVYRISDLIPADYIVCTQFTTSSMPVGFSTSDDFLATVMAPGASGYSVSTNGARVPSTDRFLLQQSGGATVLAGGAAGRPMTYGGVCYPSSPTVSGGTAVNVASGAERAGVDLAIRLAPAFNISGQLSGPDGPAVNYMLHLVAADSGDLSSDPDVATAVTAPDGSFMFLNVAPGQYVIQTVRVRPPAGNPLASNPLARGSAVGPAGAATVPGGPTLWTATAVTVRDSDVSGLNITLAAGDALSGSVVFEGAAERPQAEVISRISITVEAADGKPRAIAPSVRVGTDGRFTTAGYPAGRFLVRASAPFTNWMLRSVMYGGSDISDTPVELGRGDVAGIVITFTDRVTRLSGTVAGLTGQDAATVLLFPADSKSWMNYGANPRRLRAMRARDMGDYDFGAVPPGEYFLAAVDETIITNWQDPRFLEAVAQVAERVTIADGAQVTRRLSRMAVRLSGGGSLARARELRAGAIEPRAPDAFAVDARAHGPFAPSDDTDPDQVRDPPRVVTSGTGSISGVVLTGEGNSEPVRRARVSLRGADTNVDFDTLTDEQGLWRIGGLAAGRYTATISKPAHVTVVYGVQRPGQSPSAIVVRDGETVTGLTVRMYRGAVIAGRVIDESGAPVPGASVRVSQIETFGGERRLVDLPTGVSLGPLFGLQTDDLGQYRAYGLPAGTYVVSLGTGGIGASRSILPAQDVRTVSAEDLRAIDQPQSARGPGGASQAPFTPMGGRAVGYAPIFHPSAVMVDDATQVTVSAGEERGGVDIMARLVPMALVRGHVVGPDGQPLPSARLSLLTYSAGGISSGGYSSSTMLIGKDGAFTTRPLAPGRYTLSGRGAPRTAEGAPAAELPSSAMTLVADVDLDVRGDDIDNMLITLQEGATLRGRVVFDGDSPRPAMSALRLSLSQIASSRVGSGASGRTADDATFVITGVASGDYRPSVLVMSSGLMGGSGSPSPWVLRSVQYEGRDIIDRPLRVQAGQNLDDLLVTMTDRLPELSGTLMDAAGQPVPDLTMVLFSTSHEDWTPNGRRVLAPQKPDNAGRFLFPNVPPGEYFLAAVSQATRNDLANPAFLQEVSALAIKVTIAERERKVQDLRIAK